jgi:hypothetical protein
MNWASLRDLCVNENHWTFCGFGDVEYVFVSVNSKKTSVVIFRRIVHNNSGYYFLQY